MLHFFRKYQKIFFLFLTAIIVVTFVFFGTYQAIAPSLKKGSAEEPSYLSQMVHFIESEPWMISKRIFAANYLNDHVVSKDFLESGLGDLIANEYLESLEADWEGKYAKEKAYTPYIHPYISTLTAEMIWSIFAPEMAGKLKAFQENPQLFNRRKELFLAQKEIPPAFISQVIRYQEQNNPKVPADPRLAKEDISLFGYRHLSDWFGEPFLERIAHCIISTANKARELGYKVTKEEIIAELLARSQETYDNLKNKLSLPVNDGYGFFQLYLNQLGLKEESVIKIWEDVTLFRKLMHAVGDAALIDGLPVSQFYAFAFENATIELHQLPPHARLHSLEDIKKLESYLAAVGEAKKSPFDIPLNYASIETIERKAPELIGKKYKLSLSQVTKQELQSMVTVKEMLEWECDLSHWATIQQQFPQIAQTEGTPFDIVEQLDARGRKLVDTFARKNIVEAHPEWLEQALARANQSEKELFLSSKTEKPLEGIVDCGAFIEALEKNREMGSYSQNGTHFYAWTVIEKSGKEILSFKEALKTGLLDPLIERMQGERLAQEIVEATPEQYKALAFVYRFLPFVENTPHHTPSLGLSKQFEIEKKEVTLTRIEPSFIPLDEVLALKVRDLSPVKLDKNEGAYFYKFVDVKTDKTFPLEKIVQMQDLFSNEVKCRYFETLLAEFDRIETRHS